MIEVKGVNGQLRFDGVAITISRKGLLGFMSQGLKGDKSIDVTSVSSIQFKNAGMLTNGFIQFAFVGGRESKAGIFDATQDENTVMFAVKSQKEFEGLRDAVKVKIAEYRNRVSGSAISEADELEKLAGLRDRGILTEEEFQTKKAKILGL